MPVMTDEEVIRLSYSYYSGLFPKTCTGCGRRFATLREYILGSRRLGATISYDAELRDWKTTKPLGAAALSNCSCGSTLSLTTDGLPLEQRQQLLEWIRVETERRGVSAAALLDLVRDEVRRRALNDPGEGENT
jgi:hypothetical protein